MMNPLDAIAIGRTLPTIGDQTSTPTRESPSLEAAALEPATWAWPAASQNLGSLRATLGHHVGRTKLWGVKAAFTFGAIVVIGGSLVSPVQAAGPTDFPPIDHARGAVVEDGAGGWAYQVEAGDTAFSIARRFGIPLETIDMLTPYDLAGGELPAGAALPLPSGLIDPIAPPTPTAAPTQPQQVAIAVPATAVPNPEVLPASVEPIEIGGEMFYVGGAALLLLGAVFYAARRRDDGGFDIGPRISEREARRRLRNGEDVYTPHGHDANQLARGASRRGRSVRDKAHGDGYYSHYHPEERNGGHAMFGRRRPNRDDDAA